MAARSGSGAAPISAASELLELLRRLRSLGVWTDLDQQPLSAAFDRVFRLFHTEILLQEAPSLPAMLGEGHRVDLFSLYSAARLHSHDWDRAAASLAFDHPGAAAAVKLLYSKYLAPFDRWLGLVLDRKDDDALAKQCEGPKHDRLWNSPSKTARKEEEKAEELPMAEAEEKLVAGSKRKRGDLRAMLRWVRGMARVPVRPGAAEGKAESAEEFGLVVLARKAMVVKRPVRIGLGSLLSQRGHPSMYDDASNPFLRADENIRYSRRILNKQSGDDLDHSTHSKRLKSGSPEGSSEGSSREGSPEDPAPKRRAKVPPWTDGKNDNEADDSKWLGTQIWPLEAKDGKLLVEQSSIGQGRQDSCTCQLPGSVACVRFHVAENRLRLKRELGKVFYLWKFQRMGEEISLPWTAADEEKFKSVVRVKSQSPEQYFWGQLFESFPFKSRQSLVSYYFNVFLLRRRSYQNRVTPANIDSDDEEGEFGFLSSRLGDEAMPPRQSQKVVCAENRQFAYVDLVSESSDS